MSPIYVPAWTGSPAQVVTAVFAVAWPVFFVTEATGFFNLGYSKFATRGHRFTVPSRVGMFIIYFPAVVIPWLVYATWGHPDTPWHTLAAALVSIHFGKRCLEVLFLHRYSGIMEALTVVVITSLYAVLAWLTATVAATEVSAGLVASPAFHPQILAGLVVWTVGLVANFQHHRILANLRKPGERGYVMPRGGLFGRVACPHYLFEIVGWIGYALVFHHITAWITLLVMTAYLAGRSHNTVKWYRQHLPDQVPTGWKRLVPGVY